MGLNEVIKVYTLDHNNELKLVSNKFQVTPKYTYVLNQQQYWHQYISIETRIQFVTKFLCNTFPV